MSPKRVSNRVHTRFTSYKPSANIATRYIRGVPTIASNAIPNKKGDCQVQRLASHPFSYPQLFRQSRACVKPVPISAPSYAVCPWNHTCLRHTKRRNPRSVLSRLKRFLRKNPSKTPFRTAKPIYIERNLKSTHLCHHPASPPFSHSSHHWRRHPTHHC